MPKEAPFSIKPTIDDTSFNQKIRAIEDKMKNLQKLSGGQGSLTSYRGETSSDFGKASQRAFEIENKKVIDALKKEHEMKDSFRKRLETFMDREKKAVDELQKKKADGVKLEEQEIKTLENKLKLLEKIEEKYVKTVGQQGQIKDKLGAFTPPEPPKPIATMPQEESKKTDGLMDYLKTGRGAVALAGVIGTALKVGSSLWTEAAQKDRNIALSQGSAISTASRGFQDIAQGRGLNSAIFSKQRSQALNQVASEADSQRSRDIMSMGGEMLMGGAAGAVTGAAMGSFVPGIGTMAGGVVGGILGAGKSLFSKQNRGALFGTEEYYSSMTADKLQKSVQMEEALKQADYKRTGAFDYFQGNMDRFGGMEKAFGAANVTGSNGLIEEMVGQGITSNTGSELGQRMMRSSGMTSAGTDTRAMKQAFDLQNAGITNASDIMGTMRGLSGKAGNTDDSMKRLFAEAVRMGVNDSSMVEEFREFSAASVEMSKASGLRVEESAALLSKGSTGEMTASNLQASMSAAQMREGISGSLDPRKMANIGNIFGGNLNSLEAVSLTGLEDSEMSEDNPIVKKLMKETGIESFQEFKDKKAELDIKSVLKDPGATQSFEDLLSKRKEMSTEDFNEYLKSDEGNDKKAELQMYIEAQNKLGGGRKAKEAFTRGFLSDLSGKEDLGAQPDIVQGGMIQKGQESLAAKAESVRAKDEAFNLSNLQKYQGEFEETMIKYNASNVAAAGAVDALTKSIGESDEALKEFAKTLADLNIQANGGSPRMPIMPNTKAPTVTGSKGRR